MRGATSTNGRDRRPSAGRPSPSPSSASPANANVPGGAASTEAAPPVRPAPGPSAREPDLSPRFNKGILSSHIRSRCELALYLSLFEPGALGPAYRNLPVPLDARQGMGLIKNAGVEFETSIYEAFHAAFMDAAIGNRATRPTEKDPDRVVWEDRDLAECLLFARTGTRLVIQSSFSVRDLAPVLFANLGVGAAEMPLMPRLGKVVPDILIARPGRAGEPVMGVDGTRRALRGGGPVQVLVVVDAKHAMEANPSYESEVVLYSILLANWLASNGLGRHFAVGAQPLLWTRGSEGMDRLAECVARRIDHVGAAGAIEGCLERVNVPVHVHEIRRFFAETLPDIVRRGDSDWTGLDWHVSASCGSCGWLGHEEWLNDDQKASVAANPGHYCMKRAAGAGGHLCQVPGVSRGAARALVAGGIADVRALSVASPSDPAFLNHTRLAASRRVLPTIAGSVASTHVVRDLGRADGRLPQHSNLTVTVSVDVDAGAGLVTGIGMKHSYFAPRAGKGQTPPELKPHEREAMVKRLKLMRGRDEAAFVTDRKTLLAERAVVQAFLGRLASLLRDAVDTNRNGEHAGLSTACVVLWSGTQYEGLCDAVGRHLPHMLANGGRRSSDARVALAWLFPGEAMQGKARPDEREVPVVLLKDVARRMIATPALHAQTLVNFATFYPVREDGKAMRLPHPFYTEPFSDKIPRERIYEIWEMAPDATRTLMVRRRDKDPNVRSDERVETTYTRDHFVDMFKGALTMQARAMQGIVRHLRSDLKGKLVARAPAISLAPPAWEAGLPPDAQLWLARTDFEQAHARRECLMRFMADPEELEASNEGLRLVERVSESFDGDDALWTYRLDETGANTKLKPGDGSLVLTFEDIPGFPALSGRNVMPEGANETARSGKGQPMSSLFAVRLVDLDRAALRATVRVPRLGDGARKTSGNELRKAVVAANGGGASRVAVMPGMPPQTTFKRLQEILQQVGYPDIAVPHGAALSALGLTEAPPSRGSAVTPAARVLWDGRRLAAATALTPAAAAVALSVASGLDPSQRAAVEAALTRLLTIVWGPPGTGKTATLAGLLHGIVREAADRRGRHRILVTGPTYKAVGELASRLCKALARDPLARATVAAVGSAGREMVSAEAKEALKGANGRVSLVETEAEAGAQGFTDMLAALDGPGVTVVCAITHQCARIGIQRLKAEKDGGLLHPMFDTVVLDEASQVDMATGIFPLSLMAEGCRLVVAGDDMQMPPVAAVEPPAGAEHLVGSIMTYLIERHGLSKVPLLVNYRSNDGIVSYCRQLGYPDALSARFGGARLDTQMPATHPRLAEYVREKGLRWSPAIPRLVDPASPLVALTYPDGMAGQANRFEASLVAAIVAALRSCTRNELDGYPPHVGDRPPGEWDDADFFARGIGVVTPHRAQRAGVVRALCDAFPNTEARLIEESVDTVERFQGGQRHTILISFGVGDPDVIQGEERFLMGLERTNVAISRAMAKCIVVMSDEIATHIPVDRKASASAHALRGVVDEWCVNRETHHVEGVPGRLVTARWR